VVVNPDSTLERHARAHGWPVVQFRQRTRIVARRALTTIGAVAIAGGGFVAGVSVGGRRPRLI